MTLIERFVINFPEIAIKVVLADALYGSAYFMKKAAEITHSQVISQIKKSQLVKSGQNWLPVKRYFDRHAPVETTLSIRGGQEQKVSVFGCRVKVKAHNMKRFVVALKYEGEEEYRYLIASDLSWRYMDIAKVFTLRWLIEVIIQDWKTHGGWNQLAKHQGEEGSTRGVILSLLCDHLLLTHPEQFALLKNNQPGMPAGCLIERLKIEALITVVQNSPKCRSSSNA